MAVYLIECEIYAEQYSSSTKKKKSLGLGQIIEQYHAW